MILTKGPNDGLLLVGLCGGGSGGRGHLGLCFGGDSHRVWWWQ
jgi:hypothetical protein